MGYKAESNKWANKKNKQKLIDTDNSMVVTRGKGMRGNKAERDIYGDDDLTLGSGLTMQ